MTIGLAIVQQSVYRCYYDFLFTFSITLILYYKSEHKILMKFLLYVISDWPFKYHSHSNLFTS